MARTRQQLINYHTSSKTAMPAVSDVQFGEIVVRHNAEEPQLLIKVQSGETQVFVPFIASAKVSTEITAAIQTLQGNISSDITTLSANVKTLSGSVETFSASVVNNYATTEYVNAQDVAAQIASSAYTDSKFNELSGITSAYVASQLESVNSDISDLKAFSGVVESDYATKEFVGAASGYAYNTAKSDVIGTDADESTASTIYGAKAYTDEKVKDLSGDVVTYVSQFNTDITEDIAELSGAVETMSADVKTYIDNELSTVYTYKGSVANIDALEAIENPEVGDVYNVVAANGTIGDADYTPAGTNYAWVSGSPNGHWDALGGVVDLSNYETTGNVATLSGAVESLEENLSKSDDNINALSGAVSAFSATVVENYATKEYSDNGDTAAKIASSAYTDEKILELSGITSAYVETKVTEINSAIESVSAQAATHTEVATASGNVFTSAVTSSNGYTDGKIADLVDDATDSGNTLGKLEDRIEALETSAVGDITDLKEDVSSLMESATTWNEKTATAIQGAKFEAVTTGDHVSGGQGSGATVDSNAKLNYTPGGDIALDLSGLIIDCGDF